MKRFIKAVTVSLIFLLAAPVFTFAAVPALIYDRYKAVQAEIVKTEMPVIEYPPVLENGLPVDEIVTYVNANAPSKVSYKGIKRIPFSVKTANAAVRVESDDKELIAWFGDSHISVENNGLAPGDRAHITITITAPNLDTVTEKMLIRITDGSAYPHLIASAQDLMSVKELGLDKDYLQTGDIDLAGIKEWEPIGNSAMPFRGVYNGNNYRIGNMEFSKISTDSPALFGVVEGASARIIGVNLEGRVNVTLYPVNVHGTIVGKLLGATVDNCSFKGDIILGKGAMIAGGIVASAANNAVIKDTRFDGTISTSDKKAFIGGIAGVLMGSMDNCKAKGTLLSQGTQASIGGMTGINYGVITGAESSMSITRFGAEGKAGGIAGENRLYIYDSSYSGELISRGEKTHAAGITAVNNGTVLNCVTDGSLTFEGSANIAGGVAGLNLDGIIENSKSAMSITGTGDICYVGGIAGDNLSRIDEAWANTVKTGLSSVNKSVFTGAVSLKGDSGYVGGIAGRNYGVIDYLNNNKELAASVIENCAMLGSVDGKAAGRIAGISKLDGAGNYAKEVCRVSLLNNAALNSVLVNGEVIMDNDKNGINGQGMSVSEINGFLK